MEPIYYIIQSDGIFYIYPPSGGEWVAASHEKEEAERMQKEKNEALKTDRKQFSSPYVNGEPIPLNNITLKEVPMNYVMGEDETEKPKKKSIPRVLRPTISLPEGDWCTVFAAVYAHAKNKLNLLAAEGAPDTEYLLGELEEIKKLVRLSDYMKREVKFSCDAIRYPLDEEKPV